MPTKYIDNVLSDSLTNISFNELKNYLHDNKNAIIYIDLFYDGKHNKYKDFFMQFVNDYNYFDYILYMRINNEKEKAKFLNYYKLNDIDFPILVSFKDEKVFDIFNFQNNFKNYNELDFFIKDVGIYD